MRRSSGGGGLVLWRDVVRTGRIGSAINDRRAALLYVLERLEPRVLLSAGDLDTTFGTGGKVLTNLTGLDAATSAIVLSDGKLLVAGRVTPPDGGGSWLGLARYNVDGSLDTTFGDGGMTIVQEDAAGTDYVKIALDSDGGILASTDVHRTGQMSDFGLFRFNSDGQIDESFGDNGLVRTDVATWDVPLTLDVLSDGKIVVGGSARTTGYGVDENGRSNDKTDGVVIKYNADGTLDSGFGDGGIVHIAPASDMDWVMGRTAIEPDGTILFAGNTSNLTAGTGHAILRQIDSNGDITSLPFGNPGDDNLKGVKDAKVDTEGRIVLLLTSSDGSSHLARFNSDGSLDDTFGSGGWVNNSFALNPDASIRIAADGSIVLAGQEGNEEGVFTLSHYLSDGSLDTSFGDNGVVSTAFNSGHGEVVRNVVFTDDGKMVAVGHNGDNREHESKFLIARYDAGDWGGSGEAVDGQIVETPQLNGGDGSTSEDGSETPAVSLPKAASPFSLVPAGGDETIFGKDQDLLGASGDLF